MCKGNCKPEVCDVRNGMLSTDPIRVTTIDAELDELTDTFLNEVHGDDQTEPTYTPGYGTGVTATIEHPINRINYLSKEMVEQYALKEQYAKQAAPKRTFESGSVRDNDDNKPLPMELNPYMLIRYGYHMKGGQLNYGDSNWELGQTDVEIWRSMSRHFMQAYMNFKFPEVSKATDDGTDHLSALLFGINMLMHNECSNGVEADKYFKTRK
jgi:hypothetical protein